MVETFRKILPNEEVKLDFLTSLSLIFLLLSNRFLAMRLSSVFSLYALSFLARREIFSIILANCLSGGKFHRRFSRKLGDKGGYFDMGQKQSFAVLVLSGDV